MVRSELDVSDTTSILTGSGVGAPVRLRGTVASAWQAMSRIDVAATWEPVITPGGAWHEPSADAEMGWRLAEVFGVEAGVRADARARWQGSIGARLGEPVLEASVGMAFEPF